MRKRAPQPSRTLVGTVQIITSSTGDELMIRLLDTPVVRRLESIALDELTDVYLTAADYDLVYPTRGVTNPLRITVGPP